MLEDSVVTPNNLFLEARKGSLGWDVLSNMGLTTARMIEGDALFFYQLLPTICDPKRSGIQGGDQRPFCSEVERFTNLYVYSIGLGRSYGHKFKPVEIHELVRFDGVVVKDGVRGGSGGVVYRRWVDVCNYDEVIVDSINHS